jgi:CRISPR-associated protein Cmr1
MEVRIKTLTPLWTGGVNRTCDRIHETGILGSLRWWYEAVVRGYGGWACDPTSTDCDEKNHCNVCELFGCTGWRKKFGIKIDGDQKAIYDGDLTINLGRGWRLKSGIYKDKINLKIVPLKAGSNQDEIINLIKVLLKICSNWGGIGAKSQQGYGVIQFNGDVNMSLFEECIKRLNTKEKSCQSNLPNLKDFFFVKIRIEENGLCSLNKNLKNRVEYKGNFPAEINNVEGLLNHLKDEYKFIPSSPIVRYRIRELFRNKSLSDDLRHFILGFMSTHNKKISLRLDDRDVTKLGSKIYVSHIYKNDDDWEFRVWGWIPENAPYVDREQILKEFKESNFWNPVFGIDKVRWMWREFDSNGRCTACKTNNSCQGPDKMSSFIRCLLEV